MKKRLFALLAGVLITTTLSSVAFAADPSLRGGRDLDKLSKMFDTPKQMKKEGGFDRSWDIAPPSIPHDISKDRVSLKENTCMKCHSAANFEKEKAPKAGDSHFMTRDGKTLEKVSTRRYFCQQCHTPQADLEPLVENTFKGLPQK